MAVAPRPKANSAAVRGIASRRAESSVYDGRHLLGVIKPAGGGAFVARDSGGKKLGEFADAKLAMRAICAAARAKAMEASRASA